MANNMIIIGNDFLDRFCFRPHPLNDYFLIHRTVFLVSLKVSGLNLQYDLILILYMFKHTYCDMHVVNHNSPLYCKIVHLSMLRYHMISR